jgi:hypothetical protein
VGVERQYSGTLGKVGNSKWRSTRRREPSPNRISFDKHSYSTDLTQRSAGRSGSDFWPRTNPCDGCTRIATKHHSNHPFAPCRQRTTFHPFSFQAASSTDIGRCLPSSWRVAGAPRPE